MITGHAIELSFDPASEKRVVDLWRSIEGGLDLEELGARPHVSLAVFRPPADPATLAKCLETYTRHADRLEFSFSSVGTFPGNEGIVFLSPSPSKELLETHQLLHSILENHGVAADDLYRPGSWVPHCTVAHELTNSEMQPAIDTARSSNTFGPITVQQVNLVEFRPVTELISKQIRSD